MKPSRLGWLITVMVVLAALRLIAPSPDKGTTPSVAEAIVRKPPSIANRDTVLLSARPVAMAKEAHVDGIDTPGDAFAVRPPPAPAYVPPAVTARVTPVPAPPPIVPVVSEPPPPPMPYQVIGTWDDGQAPGVFLAGPAGTVLARPGMTLQAEYKVNTITAQQISLTHLGSNREIRLAVPHPPNTPRTIP